MFDAVDPIEAVKAVTREVRTGERDGKPTKLVVARRVYRADRADVWDAVTSPERVPRWFLPLSGDLKPGGRYQLEGNACGVVERCDAPADLAVTWEFGGGLSWVEVHLSEDGGGTLLELVHEAPVDPEFWGQFGPGAVGIGWDSALFGLDLHLAGGEDVDQAEAEKWAVGPVGVRFSTIAGESWGAAAVAAGDEPEAAQAAAANAIKFFTVPPEGA
ncbi:SRPBCC family protein [Glycomyces dulcitolivorans]|uniref:SRPBCC family protein n=1 Tax=Glycomyces dulcitolivorans TaxID=2200759 RepID=UPI000DD4BC4E|nr:SRPBCC family protein [Glycomyces dulcitolivorans]